MRETIEVTVHATADDSNGYWENYEKHTIPLRKAEKVFELYDDGDGDETGHWTSTVVLIRRGDTILYSFEKWRNEHHLIVAGYRGDNVQELIRAHNLEHERKKKEITERFRDESRGWPQ